jgi:exonuclease III
MNRIALLIVLIASASIAHADPVRIVTWNVREGFSAAEINKRGTELRKFQTVLRPDVILVQEVNSLAVVTALRDGMGLTGYHVACSDFAPSDAPDFSAFEVGIISKYPLSQVIEFDPTPDNDPTKSGEPAEEALNPVLKLGVQKPADDIRGYLWARIDALKLTVAVVHLKSSRGEAGETDRGNAQRREFIMAAVADGVVEDRQFWPDYTCLVGGDFNVGHTDPVKNGHDLLRDGYHGSAGQDGYDETHALLSGGLVGGLKMKNLVLHTLEPTFPSYPSTPIDNLYVDGKDANRFSPAQISPETFGSDHRPVSTVFNTTVRPEPKTVVIDETNTQFIAPPKMPTASKTTSPSAGAIAAAEARQHVNETKTVEMIVRSGRRLDGKEICFLNSEEDHRDKKNFTAVFFTDGLNSFKAAGIPDPAAHFLNKRIQVTGRISLRQDACQINITDPAQIKIVAE